MSRKNRGGRQQFNSMAARNTLPPKAAPGGDTPATAPHGSEVSQDAPDASGQSTPPKDGPAPSSAAPRASRAGMAFVPPKSLGDAIARLQKCHQEVSRLTTDLESARAMETLCENERADLDRQRQELAAARERFESERVAAFQEARDAAVAEARSEVLVDEERLRREWLQEQVERVGREAAEERAAAEAARAAAQETAREICAAAQDRASAIVASARADAERATAERAEELLAWEGRLAAEAELQKTKQRDLSRDSEALRWEREDLEADRNQVERLRQQATSRWEQCSPDILADRERLLVDARSHAERLEERLRETRQEADGLRARLQGGDGRSLDTLLEERDALRERCRTLAERLEALPSEEEVLALRGVEQENTRLFRENAGLRRQVLQVQDLSVRRDLAAHELTALQAQIAGYRVLVEQLEEALRRNTEALQSKGEARFPELLRLDESATRLPEGRPDRLASRVPEELLREVARVVRDYAATRPRPLFYSDATVRSFLAGMAASPLAILQGVSGTGKTSLPQIFAEAIGGVCRIVPVQSSWRDRHDLLGYNNDFTGRFAESALTRALYEAYLPRERETVWLVVLDEMNLARIEYYFADFLSEMEKRDIADRAVDLVPFDPRQKGEATPEYLLGGRLRLPPNVWFVGTANRDESTLEITDKVYDRAQVLDFREREERYTPGRAGVAQWVSYPMLVEAFEAVALRSPDLPVPISGALAELDDYLRDTFGITFGFRLHDQLRRFAAVFAAAGGSLEEAIDIQIARKVLRKLDTLLDPALGEPLRELLQLLERGALGKSGGGLHQSRAVLERRIAELAGGRP